jgi:hypothetical protein
VGAVHLVALILPWLEALLGFCLIAAVGVPGETVVSTGLRTIARDAGLPTLAVYLMSVFILRRTS